MVLYGYMPQTTWSALVNLCETMPENCPPDLNTYLPALVDDLRRVALRDRWGLGLMAIGWVHLCFFLVNQYFYVPNDSHAAISLSLWIGEVVMVWQTMRLFCGVGWSKKTPLAGLIFRVWMTFFILAFNAASHNSLTGWTVDWFKLTWMTLSSFGFAVMAWLVSPWFLINAVQMYLTGMLMYRFPMWAYVIHGTSWCLALQGIGLSLERMRRPISVRIPAIFRLNHRPASLEVPVAHS